MDRALLTTRVGIVQQAKCAATGNIEKQSIPDQERKYGFNREKLVAHNIKTSARAHMLALGRALSLAHRTIKRHSSKATQVQKLVVYSDSPKVVEIINHHIKHAPASLANATSANDRSLIKRVITRARKLSRQGFEVSIADSKWEGKEWERARIMACLEGRQACRSPTPVRMAHTHRPAEEQQEIGGERIPERTFELAIRPRTT